MIYLEYNIIEGNGWQLLNTSLWGTTWMGCGVGTRPTKIPRRHDHLLSLSTIPSRFATHTLHVQCKILPKHPSGHLGFHGLD